MGRICMLGLCCSLVWGCGDKDLTEAIPNAPSAASSPQDLGARLVPKDLQLNLDGLSAAEIEQVEIGSYLVNGLGGCFGCHGSEKGYLGGGNEFPVFFLPEDPNGHTTVIARNLTPDPETGMQLDVDQFIEAMRTGKDFEGSESGPEQRMLFMPTHTYRLMKESDLRAIHAYLQAIPPVRNPVRRAYDPAVPLPPVPAPLLVEEGDPDGVERGLQLVGILSLTPEGEAFAAGFAAATEAMSAELRSKVGRGAYLVNAISDCGNCHTDGVEDGAFDSGLLPQSFNTNIAGYLAGGVNIGIFSGFSFPVLSRNLTPHEESGLRKDEGEFFEIMRWGVDFARPGGSLRVEPHFPAEFRFIDDDLSAVYAFLNAIPPIDKKIEIVE